METPSWKPLDSQIRAFLTEFERRGERPETDSGQQFAHQFIAADPNQATVLTRDILIESLPYRRKMFAQAGVGAARCIDAAQLELDDRHLLLKSRWIADRVEGGHIELESTFLLRLQDDGPLILVYLNHRDIVATLSSL